jgi:hypothetical protein
MPLRRQERILDYRRAKKMARDEEGGEVQCWFWGAVTVPHAMHAASLDASLYSVVSEIVMRVECCGNGQTGL